MNDQNNLIDGLNTSQILVGLDLGTKTIGVAVSDTTLSVATPIKTIKRKKFSLDTDHLLGKYLLKIVAGLSLACQKIWMEVKGHEHSQRGLLLEIFLQKPIYQLLFGMNDCQL